MIPLGTLKQVVRQALGYLQSLKEIKEVEVFAASNTQLLTRLNYTSHIPCSGVEEPKSLFAFGIGIQAVFRTPDGIQIGFGSESSNLTLEGVKSAIAKASRRFISSSVVDSNENAAVSSSCDAGPVTATRPSKVIHGTPLIASSFISTANGPT